MIVYSATKTDFIQHVQRNEIADRILDSMRSLGRGGVSPSEVRSWQNSLNFMRNVLDDPAIPADAGVAVEYSIPQSSKRIDFILTGQGRAPEPRETAVIVDLKQWDQVVCTDMDAVVATFVGGAVRNLTVDGSLWIMKPHSVEQVGCIHTCQGLEVDYVGVIIGPDLLVRDGQIVTDGFARSTHDRTLRGFRKMHKEDPERATAIADRIIRNTYRTLLTRGAKGCLVWGVDEETNEWLRERSCSLGGIQALAV